MKNHMNAGNLLVALDIGTTKICVLVAQKVTDESVDIIAVGQAPSLGIARGVVVDIAQATHTIKQAVKEAEIMAGCTLESVAVGISGSHIHSLNSHGMVAIKKDSVSAQDIVAVLTAAKAVVVPEGQQILHVLPQYYVIDGSQRVLDPLGMFGVRLEAEVHIITGSIASVQNIVRCCQLAGLQVSDIILEPLASAQSVLSKDERELGVGMLDIGGGTSDFAIYQQGSIRYTKVFGTAGNHVTHDLALCLRSTVKDAERVKREFAQATYTGSTVNIEFEVEMAQGGSRKMVSLSDVIDIVEPRVSELMHMLKDEIDKKELQHLMPAGIVLTGGGSLLKHIKECAQEILRVPVRIGNPHVPPTFKETLASPVYATGYGLLLYILKKGKKNSMSTVSGPMISRILVRMKSWISDFF